MISRVKGTQDFLDLTLVNNIINKFKKHITLYNFLEIQTPIIEYLSLFQRSLGQETDVVSKEMFIIESRGDADDEKMCLRPEMTAPIARAFNEHRIQTTPWKVFSYGPCFRYERPQKGRYRQFHQITMEVIGSDSVSEDTQFLTMLNNFFNETLKLAHYELHLNYLGCADDRKKYVATLYKFLNSFVEGEICSQCTLRKERNILRVFDCKNSACQKIYQNAPRIIDTMCETCRQEWDQLKNQLTLLGVSYIHKPTLVRGLDYYNKVVFEFVSKNLGAQDAFCGGGRYNQLVQQLGASQDYPSIGAAIGLERLMLLVEHEKDVEQKVSMLAIIIPVSYDQHADALKIAHELRLKNIVVDVLFEKSLKKMFRKADKAEAAYVIVLGEDEQKAGNVIVKTMVTGHEDIIAQNDLIHFFERTCYGK